MYEAQRFFDQGINKVTDLMLKCWRYSNLANPYPELQHDARKMKSAVEVLKRNPNQCWQERNLPEEEKKFSQLLSRQLATVLASEIFSDALNVPPEVQTLYKPELSAAIRQTNPAGYLHNLPYGFKFSDKEFYQLPDFLLVGANRMVGVESAFFPPNIFNKTLGQLNEPRGQILQRTFDVYRSNEVMLRAVAFILGRREQLNDMTNLPDNVNKASLTLLLRDEQPEKTISEQKIYSKYEHVIHADFGTLYPFVEMCLDNILEEEVDYEDINELVARSRTRYADN